MSLGSKAAWTASSKKKASRTKSTSESKSWTVEDLVNNAGIDLSVTVVQMNE